MFNLSEISLGAVKRLNVPGGYVTPRDSVFHLYVPDYQGNNVAVINTKTGQAEQLTDYYPYGQPINNGLGASVNPYKYGGKELLTANGYNASDFAARWLSHSLPGFQSPDPLAHETPWLSMYMYCGGDPINQIDPTGCEIITFSEDDAIKTVKLIKSLLPGDKYKQFRNQLKYEQIEYYGQTAYSISDISNTAARPISENLNNDISDGISNQRLIDIILETIRDEQVHVVEFRSCIEPLSANAVIALKRLQRSNPFIKSLFQKGFGDVIPMYFLVEEYGPGINLRTNDGTYSIIAKNGGTKKDPLQIIFAHEVFGHGRLSAAEANNNTTHDEVIKTENLFRWNGMNLPLRDGTTHNSGRYISDFTGLPSLVEELVNKK